MKTTRVFLVLFFSFLLLQSSFGAKDADKGTKKKDTPKKEAKPTASSPNPTPATSSKGGLEDIKEIISEYSNKAYTAGYQYAIGAWAFLDEYTHPYTNELHGYLSAAADQYLDEHSAKIAKQWFNIYGIFVFSLFSFSIGFLIPNIPWIISVDVLQPFLSTLGLGIYGTLFSLSQIIQDPAIQVAKASKTAAENWRYAELAFFGILVLVNLLALISQNRKTSSFTAVFLNGWLIVDHLKLVQSKPGIPYSLHLISFIVLTFIAFGRRARTEKAPSTSKGNRNTNKLELQTKPKERDNQDNQKPPKKKKNN